jgi:hypothetical protein
MAKGKGGAQPAKKIEDDNRRTNGKAFKKRPKIFDAIKRRLVVKKD